MSDSEDIINPVIKTIFTFWMNKDEMQDPSMDNVLRFAIMFVFGCGAYVVVIELLKKGICEC